MTFSTFEESLQSGRPIELYEITVGQTIYRFTSSEKPINDGVNDFFPAPISRDEPKVNNDQPGSQVTLRMATNFSLTQELCRLWVARAPSTGDTRVRIWRHHTNNTDFQLFWIGYLVSTNYEAKGTVTNFVCKSLDNLFTLQGPRKTWGTLCNHQVFGPECRLNENNFAEVGVISAIAADGVTITIPSVPAATVTYVGGELRKTGTPVTSLIVFVSGNDYTIQYPNPDFAVGDSVQLVEGCNHTLTHCALFPNVAETSGTNVENFGGTPYTPPINLFTKGGDAL